MVGGSTLAPLSRALCPDVGHPNRSHGKRVYWSVVQRGLLELRTETAHAGRPLFGQASPQPRAPLKMRKCTHLGTSSETHARPPSLFCSECSPTHRHAHCVHHTFGPERPVRVELWGDRSTPRPPEACCSAHHSAGITSRARFSRGRPDASHWDGIAAHCDPENKVPLGFVERFNNKIQDPCREIASNYPLDREKSRFLEGVRLAVRNQSTPRCCDAPAPTPRAARRQRPRWPPTSPLIDRRLACACWG